MGETQRMWPRLTLARQLLGLQALIVLLVVLGATPVLWVQDEVSFRRVESRQARATAEKVAGSQVLQLGLASGVHAGVAGEAERSRTSDDATYLVVTDADGAVIYTSDPTRADGRLERVVTGASEVEVVTTESGKSVEASAPVRAREEATGIRVGDVVGYVLVGRDYPSAWERLGATAPTLLIYVAVGSVVGLGGSLLLSRRIKRQTLGLEPLEIRGLVEHREAMLHGLREGVVGVDADGRVTVVNDEAVRLLGLESDPTGEPLDTLPVSATLAAVLGGQTGADDLAVAAGGLVLVVNQMPVVHDGNRIGWVTTLRDRTELVDLNRQLDVWRSTTDTLRSQAHEFSNRLHTIAGLIELGEYDEVITFVTQHAKAREGWVERVARTIEEPSIAALLVAKGSRATELGVNLELEEGTTLPPLDAVLTADVLTVAGNLVDNAMDAVTATRGTVRVRVEGDAEGVTIQVTDDGPGLPEGDATRVFDQGFTTKHSPDPGARGWGLALSRLTCEQRGGAISVRREGGRTVFVARLPINSATRPAGAVS
jgi:sensor histidine kinase regulating citrate/malate metabolism